MTADREGSPKLPPRLSPSTVHAVAIVTATGLVIIAGFQVALALGVLWGRAAYGRTSSTLPPELRVASGRRPLRPTNGPQRRALPILLSMTNKPPIHRVEVSFVGVPPVQPVERAAGVSGVETDGLLLRCRVTGSFQPFLEALRGHEVVSLTSTPERWPAPQGQGDR